MIDALRAAAGSGLPVDVTTIAEAVGSDITNVVRSCVEASRFGAAAHLLSTYLANDLCVAVSEYTRELIITAATEIDARHGTRFAGQCAERVAISYPAIDSSAYIKSRSRPGSNRVGPTRIEPRRVRAVPVTIDQGEGSDDLIAGFARSRARHDVKLVVAGNGPEAVALRAQAATSGAGDRILFLDDVSDEEKPFLMAGSAAFVLPSKPRPEFVETFGIALVEKMLAGGGPVITCPTGGIPEAVGDTALMVPVSSPQAIAEALDFVIGGMTPAERARREVAARAFAMRFDRDQVFDKLFGRIAHSVAA